ncbi:hypothetical protein C8J56DRAFT_893716 [Mycena floridula]|nr:hypothetical protein C8J56DRAFT_893716 [Mycena floridula]
MPWTFRDLKNAGREVKEAPFSTTVHNPDSAVSMVLDADTVILNHSSLNNELLLNPTPPYRKAPVYHGSRNSCGGHQQMGHHHNLPAPSVEGPSPERPQQGCNDAFFVNHLEFAANCRCKTNDPFSGDSRLKLVREALSDHATFLHIVRYLSGMLPVYNCHTTLPGVVLAGKEGMGRSWLPPETPVSTATATEFLESRRLSSVQFVGVPFCSFATGRSDQGPNLQLDSVGIDAIWNVKALVCNGRNGTRVWDSGLPLGLLTAPPLMAFLSMFEF